MNWKRHLEQRRSEMEDFWGRRETRPRHLKQCLIFGRPLILESSSPEPLAALEHSLPLFAKAPERSEEPLRVQIAVRRPPAPPGPAPEDLMERTWYSGDGEWLMIHAAAWGHVYIARRRARAVVVLAPELAARPALLSRCLLNTVILNLCLGSGMGMLHASCLVRDGRALLLLAPHNSGKSTTSLHLALAGFRLATDSMVHIIPGTEPPLLAGFPVGRIKLRGDVLHRFPALQGRLEAERVRHETKFAVDLRDLNPDLVEEMAIAPDIVELCLLSRHDDPDSRVTPARVEEVRSAIAVNSIFYDTESIWQENLAQIDRLLRQARFHHLTVGVEPAGIVEAVERLWRA